MIALFKRTIITSNLHNDHLLIVLIIIEWPNPLFMNN